jgi:hypothetical protein
MQHAGRYWRREHQTGRSRRAAVINTSSRAGLAPRVPRLAWYGAAKGAIATLTLGAALELLEFGVRVNAIAPHSFTRQDAAASGVEYDFSKEHALGPDKVAPVVAWLASDANAAINGCIFWVEGGTVSHYEKWRIGPAGPPNGAPIARCRTPLRFATNLCIASRPDSSDPNSSRICLKAACRSAVIAFKRHPASSP